MKTNDPDQLNIFQDAPPARVVYKPVNEYVRVQDKLNAAAALNQSLIRLQPGYGGQPWIIKKQSKGDVADGWTYLKKYDTEQEARDAYASLLGTGEYAEG